VLFLTVVLELRRTKDAEEVRKLRDGPLTHLPSTEPPKKKPKSKAAPKSAKSKGKGPGRKAKLAFFANAPLDVIVLVMNHLEPKDLLAMSRTSSALRAILHSAQGKGVWKNGRKNVGLPDLTTMGKPGGIEEWELASLLYDGTCHARSLSFSCPFFLSKSLTLFFHYQICHKTKAKTVDYCFKVRACAGCMRSNSLQRSKIPGEKWLHSQVWTAVPESHCSLSSFPPFISPY
jgi:hypothetical protein